MNNNANGKSRMKNLVLRATLALAMAFATLPGFADAPASTGPAPATTVDVDQLAARMKKNVEIYQRVRDQALAAYARLHPSPAAYDADAQQSLRLAAYLWVWGDFYREGLGTIAADDAMSALRSGAKDPMLLALTVIHVFDSNHLSDDPEAQEIDATADQLAGTDYPAALKFWYDRIDAKNLVSLKTGQQSQDPKTLALLPGAVAKAAKAYGDLIKLHLDNDLLFEQGHTLLHDLQSDGESLQAAHDTIDQCFAQEDPNGVLRQAMQGAYFTDFAWTARGTDYADKVTPEGMGLFADRLQTADGILEKAYADHPGAGILSREMLTVELGQGQGRDRMELWFGRAIQANPDDFLAYSAKAYYLSPEWYGSDDDLWNFGVKCAATQNWSAKIPMILVDIMVSYLWKKHPEILADQEKWAVVESTFRGYLAHYPRSNYYRSVFARCAVIGGHWAVAEEQFKLLGNDWDRIVFPGQRYPQMKGLADKNGALTP